MCIYARAFSSNSVTELPVSIDVRTIEALIIDARLTFDAFLVVTVLGLISVVDGNLTMHLARDRNAEI